jgi:hypothetical protein
LLGFFAYLRVLRGYPPQAGGEKVTDEKSTKKEQKSITKEQFPVTWEHFFITWDKKNGTTKNFAGQTKKSHVPGKNFLIKGTIFANIPSNLR